MSSPDFWFYTLGTALGSEPVDAAQLAERYGPVREGFLERTGFETLYRTPSGLNGLELATQALAGIDPTWLAETVDGLIFVTSTGERSAPGNAHLLQSALGLTSNVFTLDVNDACTGFVRAVALASSLLQSGTVSRVLVVLSDTYSKLYSESDLKVSPLFSDGASALLFSSERVSGVPAQVQERHWQIIGSSFKSEGGHADDLTISRSSPAFEFGELTMNGGGVFNFVIKHLKGSVSSAASSAGIQPEAIDKWYVHQGSRAVVNAAEKVLDVAPGTLFRSSTYGNVVGSAVPFQLVEDQNESAEAHIIGMAAFGVGLTIGVLVLKQFAR